MLAFHAHLLAQDVVVEGYFTQDSAKLGERVTYVLKATYPSQLNILFPDSLHNYGSMEFLEKQTFRSYSQDTVTVDSAVYFLSNFSLDPVKNYRLPVYEILRYDSIAHMPADATLALKLIIDNMPDALAFQQTNAYQKVLQAFNYPVLIISIIAFVTLVAVALYFFGGKIKSWWLVHLEKQRRKRFLDRWEKAKQTFLDKKSVETADELLGIWRGYMETITGEPFREWTSTEIASYFQQPELIRDLREIEVVIYANRVTEGIYVACDRLTGLSEEAYQSKIKQQTRS